MTMTKAQTRERDEARERLREILKPGDTLHTISRHTSRSGMMRAIDVIKLETDDERGIYHLWLSRLAATATGYTFSEKYDAVRMDGCGMDMGFALVYAIGRALWSDGYGCPGKGCQSNDHVNPGERRNDYTPHDYALGVGAALAEDNPRWHWHRDGGYALRHRWL